MEEGKNETGVERTGQGQIKTEVAVAPQIAHGVELTQINKFHTKGGTGFSAEEANALADKFAGHKVEQVGTSNTLNGADRIVDGVPVQTKYFSTSKATMESAFGTDGTYRYTNQRLEVPADQYEACVQQMREKIANGKVPGVTDPEKAAEIVQKGNVTYQQARNIARVGTIDGLVYDVKTHSIGAAFVGGLSFAIQFAQLKWNGASTKEAIREASLTGLGSGALTLTTGALTSQVLRTRAAAIGVKHTRDAVRAISSTQFGRAMIAKIARASLGKTVNGGAAINHVAKLARSNAVSGVVVTVVMATPDFYRAAFAGSISWKQFGKNLAGNGTSIAGGIGGWMGGAAAGASIGTAIFPGVGTTIGGITGGIVGSLGIGTLAGFGAKKALDQFVDDDAIEMMEVLNRRLPEIASDYLVTEDEFEKIVEFLKAEIRKGLLREMYASKKPAEFFDAGFIPFCEELAKQRERITLPTPSELDEAVVEIIDEAVQAVAVEDESEKTLMPMDDDFSVPI
jgi:hypothetical protein